MHECCAIICLFLLELRRETAVIIKDPLYLIGGSLKREPEWRSSNCWYLQPRKKSNNEESYRTCILMQMTCSLPVSSIGRLSFWGSTVCIIQRSSRNNKMVSTLRSVWCTFLDQWHLCLLIYLLCFSLF